MGARARITVSAVHLVDVADVTEVDLSSHNTNPPGVFDGEAVPLSDVADTWIERQARLFGSSSPSKARFRQPRADRGRKDP
jgi:hypothetical protein